MAEPAASEVSLRPGGGGGAPPGLSLRPGAGATMGSFGLMTAPPRAKKVRPATAANREPYRRWRCRVDGPHR